jgi:hypothetical protein
MGIDTQLRSSPQFSIHCLFTEFSAEPVHMRKLQGMLARIEKSRVEGRFIDGMGQNVPGQGILHQLLWYSLIVNIGMGPLETVARQYKWPHRMIFCSETKSLYYKSTRQLEYLDSFPTRIAEQNVAYPRIAIGSAEK